MFDLPIVKFHGDLDYPDTTVLTETDYFERLRFETELDLKLRLTAEGVDVAQAERVMKRAITPTEHMVVSRMVEKLPSQQRTQLLADLETQTRGRPATISPSPQLTVFASHSH